MPRNIDDLRDHLFETLAALRNKDAPMELDRAKAIADVGKVIVESAKAENDFMKITGAAQGSGFIPAAEGKTIPAAPAPRRIEASAIPAGEACVLCGIRLTTPLAIERGLCGSCSDRPEAKTLPRNGAGKAVASRA